MKKKENGMGQRQVKRRRGVGALGTRLMWILAREIVVLTCPGRK